VQPARRKADEVAEDLLSRIVRGELAVGSVLPRESDLAESYGVNRGVVREANKLLEVHRLVRPIRRRGTEVLDPMCSVTPAVLSAMLVDRRGRIDPDMLAEFLEIRALLDVEVTVLAALRRTDDDLDALEQVVCALERAEPGSPEAFENYGRVLAEASKNRIFVMLSYWHSQIVREIQPLLATVRAPTLQSGGHRVVLEAIRARDSELARRLVGEFHRWANERLLQAAREGRHAGSEKKRKL
jgi:DNA-binding FadR family transcriptional regulator